MTRVLPLSRRRWLHAAAGVGVLTLLVACSETPAFMGSNITGARLGKALALVDHAGQSRTLADYAGKVVVVFFGFTQCPDVCPTSLAELAQVMRELGGDAAQDVQVLMVTVDPERDTPDALRQYVTAFDPRFVGLTGTPEQIRQAAASFKVFYAKVPREDGDYSMDHSAAFFLLDRQGESRVLTHASAGAAALVHDLRLLLSSRA